MDTQTANDLIERIWALEHQLTQTRTGLVALEQIVADEVTDADSI